MIASETSRFRIDEMVQRSETGRRANEAARELRGPRASRSRRLAAIAATIALWPLRR
jgi:hypothetical protein